MKKRKQAIQETHNAIAVIASFYLIEVATNLYWLLCENPEKVELGPSPLEPLPTGHRLDLLALPSE